MFSSQILQNAEMNIVMHWKFWRKYVSVSHLFSCKRKHFLNLRFWHPTVLITTTVQSATSKEQTTDFQWNLLLLLPKSISVFHFQMHKTCATATLPIYRKIKKNFKCVSLISLQLFLYVRSLQNQCDSGVSSYVTEFDLFVNCNEI